AIPMSIPGVSITPPDGDVEQTDNQKVADEALGNNNGQQEEEEADDQQAANIARLQILSKQLLFASVPTFLNHLFGAENTITGLNKSFDILQYQSLNKQ